MEPGQPFKYTATVEVRPRVEPKDYEGLTVPKVEAQVTDAQVDERIASVEKQIAASDAQVAQAAAVPGAVTGHEEREAALRAGKRAKA